MKGRAAIAVLTLLAWGHAAGAAETSFVGKSTSSYTNNNFNQPSPGFVMAASAPLPDKYSSKKNFLNVTVMIQENCTSDLTATSIKIGGILAQPDPSGVGYTECDHVTGWHMVTRTWTMPPESLGGAAVPEGSTIDVMFYSNGGTAMYDLVAVNAVATK